ncbi:MAG TPA: cysteine desulfurase family protein, partial [Acidimicrobiia bacterium]|nr:cysteine desulfurase family protein [Acidimicrobiia bacterium]
EHKAVLAAGGRLADEGFDVRPIRVGGDGVVDLASLEDAVGSDTVLVSVMLVNNEVGTIQPLADVARVVRARAPHAVLHTDAVQAVPWLDMSTAAQAPDLVSISGHKFGGPKGVGALVVRQGVPIVPLLEGGGQERGWRAGTVNVPGVVALATALQVAQRERVAENRRVGALRDRLQAGLLDTVAGAFVNGDPNRKVAGNCHVGFPEVEAESLLVALDQADVYAAAGSSCSSGATEPSHVLAAMGVPRARALASIRLSLGFASTEEDVDRALEVIPGAVADLRAAARVAS